MTSASELFYTRRSRIGRNPNLGFSPSPSPSPDRNLHHHFHRHHHNHPREEGCDPVPRRSSHGPPNARHLCHRVSQTERESVRFDLSTSPGTGNSSSGGTSSSRTNRPRLTTNNRLPGAVVQARARLFERLRGVSISENSHSRTNPGISWEEFAISDGFRIVDTGDWETEIPEWFVAGAPFTDITVHGRPTPDSLHTSKKKPPGLSLEDINCLQREVFNVVEGDGVSRAMRECCICLESFQKGDVLICLPCDHRYHPNCLDPWVKACGDCPYCRTGIVIDRVGHRKLQNQR